LPSQKERGRQLARSGRKKKAKRGRRGKSLTKGKSQQKKGREGKALLPMGNPKNKVGAVIRPEKGKKKERAQADEEGGREKKGGEGDFAFMKSRGLRIVRKKVRFS